MACIPALVFIGFFVLASVHVAAGAPEAGAAKSVAEATKRLESARAALAAAVQRIENDPPSNEDLDAVLAAVEALKNALDAGASFKTADLDYAKAVLADARSSGRAASTLTSAEPRSTSTSFAGASTARWRP